MKKQLTTGIILLSLLSTLTATPLTGTGYGANAEDAKANALKDLTEQVVLSQSYVTLQSNKEDSKGNTSSAFQSASIQSGSFTVLGVNYTATEKTGKDFTVKATIEDTAANKALYLAKTEETAASINSVQALIDKTEDDGKKVDLYLSLLEILDDYDFYKGVAAKLYSPSALPPGTPVSITRKTAEAYCQSYMMQDTSNMESQIEVLKLQLKNQALTNESKRNIEKQIEESNRALEEMKTKQRRITEDSQSKFQELKVLFNASISSAHANLEQTVTQKDQAQSLTSAISIIQSYGNFYEETRTSLRDYLNTLYVSAEKEMKAKEEEITSQPYKAIEMNGNKPKAEAIKFREKQIQDAQTVIRNSFRGTETKIFKEALSQWKAIYYSTEAALDDIEGKSFQLSSNSQTYFSSSNFDLASWTWKGTSLLTIGDKTYLIDIDLPYDVWCNANKEMNPVASGDDYMAKIEAAQMWQDLFEEYPELLIVTIDGEIKRENGAIIAKAKSYTIKSSLTGEEVYKAELTMDSIVLLNIAAMDFSVNYNGGSLSAIIYDSNGLDIAMPEDFIFYGGEIVELPSAEALSKGLYRLQGWENSYGVGYKAGAKLPEGIYSGVLKAIYRTLGSSQTVKGSYANKNYTYTSSITASTLFSGNYVPTSDAYSGKTVEQKQSSGGSAAEELLNSIRNKNNTKSNQTTTSTPSYTYKADMTYRTQDELVSIMTYLNVIYTSYQNVYPSYDEPGLPGFGTGFSIAVGDYFMTNLNVRFGMGSFAKKNSLAMTDFVFTNYFSADIGSRLRVLDGYLYFGLGGQLGMEICDDFSEEIIFNASPIAVGAIIIPITEVIGLPINLQFGINAELKKQSAITAFMGMGIGIDF